MTLKKYLIMMSLATVASLIILAVIVFYLNPQEAGWWGLVLFYAALLATLLGIFALLGFILRVWLTSAPIFHQVSIAFRQGAWFAILIVFCLILQSHSWLSWWVALLAALLLSAIETWFLSLNQRGR